MTQIELFGYWRSSSTYRVRIVLHWKELPFRVIPVDLVEGKQHEPSYIELNPGACVPTMIMDGVKLTQSVAIMEYLEEMFPEKSLLPQEPAERAMVRAIVNVVACDISPLQNLKATKAARPNDSEKQEDWIRRWITEGFKAIEQYLKASAKTHAVGDRITLADVVLVPQVYNARRFNVDMALFPTITRVADMASQLEAFQKAHPDNQPDSPAPK